MNRFALIGFWRTLTRHRLYAALNIGGLALGIAVFVMLSLYVRFQTGFERWLPGAEQVYLVVPHNDWDTPSLPRTASPVPVLPAIQADVPRIVGTRTYSRDAAVIKDGVGVSEQLAEVDPAFFDVFRFHAIEGTLPTRFRDPSTVVITRRTARKYFGDASPIGRTLSATYDSKRTTYRVVAVIDDLPADTELQFDLLAPLVITDDRANDEYVSTHQWNYNHAYTYVRLPDAAAVGRLTAALPGVVKRHAATATPDQPQFTVELLLRSFVGQHLRTPGATLMVTTLGIVGVLTLALAIINYVNLATARGGLRAREVAMRKVLGASRSALLRHFVGEAIVTAGIATVIGLALAELGLPLLNAATGLTLSIAYFGAQGVLLPLALLALVVGTIAGLYPAVVLSRTPAAAVLASARSLGGGRAGARVREGLVVFQFAVTIALIVGTAVLAAQTWHVRSADVGYDRGQLLVVRSFGSNNLDAAQRDALVHRFASLPGVTRVSVGDSAPGGGWFTAGSSYTIPGAAQQVAMVDHYQTYPGFFETLGAHVIAGRLFDPARPGDVDPTTRGMSDASLDLDPRSRNDDSGGPNLNAIDANVVLNRAALSAFRFASPQAAIGKVIGAAGGAPRTVIGVIEDMRVGSARSPVSPTVYQFALRPTRQTMALIRFTGEAKPMLAAAEQAWRQEAPQVPFVGKTAMQALDRFYAADNRMANLFAIGSLLAVAIGCVGLWGLASFTTSRRVKEIGIRKTLGASSRDIVRLLVGQFLRPVLVANLFAWPLAFVAMRAWLSGFDDRIALSPLFFVGASLVATAIAIGTVLSQAMRASRAAPAKALRDE